MGELRFANSLCTRCRLGWAGQCENLFQLDKLDSARLCQKACTEDPRCAIEAGRKWNWRAEWLAPPLPMMILGALETSCQCLPEGYLTFCKILCLS